MAVKRIAFPEAPDGSIDPIDRYQLATLVSFGTSEGGGGEEEETTISLNINTGKIVKAIVLSDRLVFDVFSGKILVKINDKLFKKM